MNYNHRNNGYRNNHRKANHPAQTYVWVVRNHKLLCNKVFRSKVNALEYYYRHQYDCSAPVKRMG